MDFYYFNRFSELELISELEDSYFYGVLLPYHNRRIDFFTKVARDIKLNQKIKYMVAIRPYTISPQYVSMINQSINEIDPGRLEINLVYGKIAENEKEVGGIIGPINDLSSYTDRSGYLVSYIDVLNEMKKSNPDYSVPNFYVSVTNEYVFNAANKTDSKMIIKYRDYKVGHWSEYINYEQDNQIIEKGKDFDLTNKNVILFIDPILRKTNNEINNIVQPNQQFTYDCFTYQEFNDLINKLKNQNINKIMLSPCDIKEKEYILDFVKIYKEKELIG